MRPDTLLLVHACATLFMSGLIWFVQWVHYPLFASVGVSEFHTYALEHQRRTSRVVVPVMLTEAATAIGLVVELGNGKDCLAAWFGFALLILIWLSTALIQVPYHRQLRSGFDPLVIRRLIETNWLRTVAWTLRSVVALWLLRPEALA